MKVILTIIVIVLPFLEPSTVQWMTAWHSESVSHGSNTLLLNDSGTLTLGILLNPFFKSQFSHL